MKRFTMFLGLGIALTLTATSWAAAPDSINFQGRLQDGSGNPVTVATDVHFRIYDGTGGGAVLLWGPETHTVTPDAGGLYNVTLGSLVSFPANLFASAPRFLGITVESDPELSPRTLMASVAYALRVKTVDSASGGTITSKVSIGPGHTNTGINAFVTGEGSTASGDYSTVGGGRDNFALDIGTTVAGGRNNFARGRYATVGGGGGAALVDSNSALGWYSTVSGGQSNAAVGQSATVGGGHDNTVTGSSATVAGGALNAVSSNSSTIGGGLSNNITVSGVIGTVGGGNSNTVNGFTGTVSGGNTNTANAEAATVGGGNSNTAGGFMSTVAGGRANHASGDYSFVTGQSDTASGFWSAVGGGVLNIADDTATTVAGGRNNRARGRYATVGGGGGATLADSNSALGQWSTVSGGRHNTASGVQSTVGGGQDNIANDFFATVGGGSGNTAVQQATVGGGYGNAASELRATIAGGFSNIASGDASTVGGGRENLAADTGTTVAGGRNNKARGRYATVGGGGGATLADSNSALGEWSTVSGGSKNTANNSYATIGGGYTNTASQNGATVGGGIYDTASGFYATVPGGYANKASGDNSFAAGRQAKALHPGAFVWADRTFADFASTAANQFLIRADGGVGIGTNAPYTDLTMSGSIGYKSGTSPMLYIYESGTSNQTKRVIAHSPGFPDFGLLYNDSTDGLYIQGPRLGVGTNSPLTQLHVAASGDVATFNRSASDGIIVRLDQAGITEGTISVSGITVSYNAFTGSHYGWTEETVERGELVSLTGVNRNSHDNPKSEIIYGIKRSAVPNDPSCLGSYLALSESSKPYSSENPHLVMAVGNGEMWVVDEGRDIKPGDYLISSSTPGHAMRDDEAKYPIGHIVARAAEGVDWSAVGETVNGRKHKKISVLFGNFVRSNPSTVAQTLDNLQEIILEQRKEIEELKKTVSKDGSSVMAETKR